MGPKNKRHTKQGTVVSVHSDLTAKVLLDGHATPVDKAKNLTGTTITAGDRVSVQYKGSLTVQDSDEPATIVSKVTIGIQSTPAA